ncbi:MAG: radical SAM protein [Verrucomicrobiota bacterium]|jgi:radical SAM superfamily enzyme YgiQ (UPF0313 family)
MKLELITAEGPATLWMRKGRLIRFPQLTMPLLAALTPGDVEIHHTDEIVSQVNFNRAVDLVGITTTTCSAPHAYDVADEFRRRGVAVVLGGPHPTLLPHEAARHADSVLIGEAEGVWPTAIRDFQEGRLKRFYRAAVPPSLAGLPWARRELIERRAYGRGVLIATRSCPNACGYCMLPHFYHHYYRCRPSAEVIAEAASIQEKALIFWDDNIIGNIDYARELFRRLIPLRKRWTSQATFNIVDHDDLIHLAAASGCEALFIGLESISAASLRETGKAFNKPQRYLDGIKKLHDAGIAVQTGLVFGFDNDDVTVFERTLAFLEQAGVDVASIGSLTPFPGTPIFRKLEEEGRILSYDWSKYNARTDVVFRPRRMTPDHLQAGVEWVTKQFYSLSSISRRLLARSWTGLWWNIPRNLGYKIAFDKLGRRGYNPAGQPRHTTSRPSGGRDQRVYLCGRDGWSLQGRN